MLRSGSLQQRGIEAHALIARAWQESGVAASECIDRAAFFNMFLSAAGILAPIEDEPRLLPGNYDSNWCANRLPESAVVTPPFPQAEDGLPGLTGSSRVPRGLLSGSSRLSSSEGRSEYQRPIGR